MEHAKFLLSQMRNESTAAMGWTNTPFYKWLMQNSPDVYKLYKLANPHAGRQVSISTTEDCQQSGKGKPPSSQATRNRRLGTAATIIQFMNDLHTSGFLRIPRMSIRSLGRIMYERYEIINEDLAKEVIRVHAKKILNGLGDEWIVSPIYQKLEILITGHKKMKNTELEKQAIGLVLLMRDSVEGKQADNQ